MKSKTTIPNNPLVQLADGRLVRARGNGLNALFLPWKEVNERQGLKRIEGTTQWEVLPGVHIIREGK
jgi:hypothetical protein